MGTEGSLRFSLAAPRIDYQTIAASTLATWRDSSVLADPLTDNGKFDTLTGSRDSVPRCR